MCGTVEEGGIGFRLMKDMVITFTKKQWWRFRTQDNLWSNFLSSKYWRGGNTSRGEGKKNDSYGWRKMCKVQKEVEEKMAWAVGQGNMFLWSDKWLKGGTLEELYPDGVKSKAKVNNIMKEGAWNIPLIQIMFPENISSQILETSIVEADYAFWEGGEANVFSTRQVWEQSRERKEVKRLYGLIWHNNIAAKISMFIWRLLQDLIPTDLRMKRFGISMASKCLCCQEEETPNHVFLWSDTAKAVWNHFGRIANIQYRRFESIEALLKCWFYSHDWVERGHVRTWIPMVVLWVIWKARNAAKHDSVRISEEGIIFAVERKLQSMVLASKLKMKNIAGEAIFIEKFGIRSIKRRKKVISLISWIKPEVGWIKLNIDGCSRGNPGPSGAGGIARNCRGEPLCSFFSALGIRSAFLAELDALRLGLKMCRERNFNQIWIESDSQSLCNVIKEGRVGNWFTFREFAEVKKLLSGINWMISFIGREANAPADCLANWGLESGSTTTVLGCPPLRGLRGAIVAEKAGWPYIRRRRV